jgi:phage tail sheath protein FI
MAFSTINKAPGVYIDEFEPQPPIAGVATNIPAFVGEATKGPYNEPVKITSWDQFREVFGDSPIDGRYLWYALRGFYANGGTVCYVVRATGATFGSIAFANRATNAAWTLTAREPGPAIAFTVAATPNRLTAGKAFMPTSKVVSVSGRDFTITANTGKQFRPGDNVMIKTETLTVQRVVVDTLTVTSTPAVAHGAGENVTLANTDNKTKVLRVTTSATPAVVADLLVPGAILTLKQGAVTETLVVASVQAEYIDPSTSPPTVTYRVTFRSAFKGGYKLDASAGNVDVTAEEFDVTVNNGTATNTHPQLSLDAVHPRYFIDMINDDDAGLVTIVSAVPPPSDSLPNKLPASATVNLPIGAAGTIGTGSFITALQALERVDEVTLVACPDAVVLTAANVTVVQMEMISHCERLADRFAILDARAGLNMFGPTNSAELQRAALDSARGYAAFYYPWLQVNPVDPAGQFFVPPSGHVCGVIARSDEKRGVHKAPANEFIADALGVQQPMSDVEQGLLNEQGINCIRVFSTGGRAVVWGARTTAPKENTNWRYVSTRRLFIYLEESIQEGIRWGVFEPNNQTLWRKLKRSITDFLMRAYRDGALFGDKPEQAFYVRIDETLNPFSEQQLGRLTIEIGIRPAFPAEFIVVRIGIWAGGSETTES